MGETAEQFTDVPAQSFCQTYRPEFIDQSRGITWLASCINDLGDIFDIREWTRLGIKGVASRVIIEHNSSGQAPDDPLSGGPTSRDTAGDLQFEKLEGGTILYARAGDDTKFEIPNDQRPSTNVQEFTFEILRGAFDSLGWPVEMYDPSRLGGANSRLRVAQAKRTLETLQNLADSIARRKHLYAIAKLIKLGVLPPNDEWWMIEHQRPRDITVDNGRDSKAELEALNNGALTFAEYFGRGGHDWQEQIVQRVAEQKFLEDECARAGVRVESIRASVLTKQDSVAAEPSAAPEPDEDDKE